MKRISSIFAISVVTILASRTGAADLPSDLAAVPGNALGFVHVRVADIYSRENSKHLRAFIAKAGPDALKAFAARFPFDPAALDRITAFVVIPEGEGQPVPSIVIRLSKPLEEAKLVADLAPKAATMKAGAVPIYVDQDADMAIRIIDKQTFQVGPAHGMTKLFSGRCAPPGPLMSLLTPAVNKPVTVGVNAAAFPEQLRAQIPAPAVPIAKLKLAFATIDMGDHATIAVRLMYPDAESAADAEQMIRSLIELGRSSLVGARAELQKKLEGDGKPATIESLPEATAALVGLGAIRQYEELLKNLPLKRDAADVSLSVDLPAGLESNLVATSAISAGLLLPAIQKVREAATQTEAANNLKQLALAMHNYHAVYNTLPPQAIMSKDGKPLLSWRVAILPFIEHDHLYKQFKLDEPWDSEHNKKLIPMMPRTFLAPNAPPPRSPGMTYYQVLVGGGAAWKQGPRGPTLANFTDGTSNTIMIVEAGDPVIWTKPDDLSYDPAKPLPGFGTRWNRKGFLVAMADGSVRFVSPSVTEATLRAAITVAGGEILGPDWQ